MADVRLLIQEEGRTARNLIAFNVPVGKCNIEKVTKKPPSIPKVLQSGTATKRSMKTTTRMRSASTGRDKKSELQARYWAFLFGNLQRAIDGIYQTCEGDENISECKEVILVLENYTRDFHNLIEWFKVKWAYENSAPPLRRTSLAWEVRKTSPCRVWNSTIVPKSTSPLQRTSSAECICNSPTNQFETKLIPSESKMISVKEEPVHKITKDNKNNVSKNGFIDGPLDKRKIEIEKTLNRSKERKTMNKTSSSKLNGGNVVLAPNNKLHEKNEKILETVNNKINKSDKDENNLEQSSSSKPPKFYRSKTSLCVKKVSNVNEIRPGTSVIVRRSIENKNLEQNPMKRDQNKDINGSVEVLSKQGTISKTKDEGDGWQTVRSRYRRGSSHNLDMSTRFYKPSSATSLPALSIGSVYERNKKKSLTPDNNNKSKKKCIVGKAGKNITNQVEKVKGECLANVTTKNNYQDNAKLNISNLTDTNSTSMIAAIFKNDAELLEKRIQQFMAAQAERERIILEEERKTEEADSQRSKQLSDEEASLQRQILELECTELDIDTETDETDGEMVLEIEDEHVLPLDIVPDDMSLEDRYENMLEGMSWAERVDTLAQLQALVARHPGRALELHQKLSSPSRKRSLPEILRRYQAKQACAQDKREKLLMEKSQRLRELLNKVEDVKSAKTQLIEDKRLRMEMRLKRAEENRTQHLLEIVRKAHDEDSKLKEIAFINELEAQNKRHDFMALCHEQEERLQGIQEERQRRQEEKAAKEVAAEIRRKALEAERQLRIQKMRQARREREERVGKKQLEREKERQELMREKARDREERLSALHAAQLANQEELQKKIAHKQQESARRHVENIEHIRQRAVELSILRSDEVPPTLKSYPAPKQCSLCSTQIPNEVCLLSHLKGKKHLEAVRNTHDGKEPSRDELQRFNISQIRDISSSLSSNSIGDNHKTVKEKQKAMKRRCRKMKQKLISRGQEWEARKKNDSTVRTTSSIESSNKSKLCRNLKELDRLYNNHIKTPWSGMSVAALERCLVEILRIFGKPNPSDQEIFKSCNGFDTFSNLLNLGLNAQNTSHSLPNKSINSLCRAYAVIIDGHDTNIEINLLSNKVIVIVDLLLQRLEAFTELDDNTQAQEMSSNTSGNGIVATVASQLLCSLIPEVSSEISALQQRTQDIVGYLVAGGLVERVHYHCRSLIETDFFLDQEHESPLLSSLLDLLLRICYHSKRSPSTMNSPTNQDSNPNVQVNNNKLIEQTSTETPFLNNLLSSEVAGTIGLMYSAIALNPQNQKASSPVPNQTTLTPAGKMLAYRGLKLLKWIAEVDLLKLQKLLGSEGISLQWRLIASHLITRLSRDPLLEKQESDSSSQNPNGTFILSELFTVIGYFALNNPENQLILQTAGAGLSALQLLCTLPFPFYGDPKLMRYTLPALISATSQNPEAKAIVSCEISYELLNEYRNSEEGKKNPLIRLLKDTPSPA